MKKLFTLVLAFLLLALPTLSLAEDAFPAADGATITVTGTASIALEADYARIFVGVSTSAPTIEDATKQNNLNIHNVIAALKEAGVLEEDITTSSYTVNPEYDYSSFGGNALAGYNVSNQLTVIIRDMEHIGATLDQATAAGANSIYNIQFLSSKTDAAKNEAMAYAVQDAFRRAKLLADAAGLNLGGIVSISDSTSGWNTSSLSATAKQDSTLITNSILPDNTSVSASVTIVFELK